MKRLLNFAWLIAIVMLFGACSEKENVNKTEETLKKLTGNWLYTSEEDMQCYLLTFYESGEFMYQSQEVEVKKTFAGKLIYNEELNSITLVPSTGESPLTYILGSIDIQRLSLTESNGRSLTYDKTAISQLPSHEEWKDKTVEMLKKLAGNWLYTSDKDMLCYFLSFYVSGEFLYQSQEVDVENTMTGKFSYDKNSNTIVLQPSPDKALISFVVSSVDEQNLLLTDKSGRTLTFVRTVDNQLPHHDWKPWNHIFRKWIIRGIILQLKSNTTMFYKTYAAAAFSQGVDLHNICNDAMREGMALTEPEQKACENSIMAITFTEDQKFIIEYGVSNQHEGIWAWENAEKTSLRIKYKENSMDNIFMLDGSQLTIEYKENYGNFSFHSKFADANNTTWDVTFTLQTYY